jgi:1,4-dihydroxy-2-naphthoate octaprenyltransferase
MSGVLKTAIAKWARGTRPSALHAALAAIAAGLAAAAITYRLVRS